jgi:hypothetical protein
MRIYGRVQEPNWAFTLLQPLLVQQVDDACENGCGRRRATYTAGLVEINSREVEAKGGDVGKCASGGVEDLFAVWG